MTVVAARRLTDDDATLVAAAKQGDRRAMDRLLRNHQDRVTSVCRRIVGNEADALDASQNAMIAIVRGLARFDGNSMFSTWVYRVATNAALDELRRRKRRPDPVTFVDHRDSEQSRIGEMVDAKTFGGVQRDPELSMDERLALQVDVDRAMATLPPEFRAAVTLRDLCGLDYSEIAEILGIPGGTVRSRIARGRAALLPLVQAAESDSSVGGNPANETERPTLRHE